MKIAFLVVLIVLVTILFAFTIFLLVRGIIINSEAYKVAIDEIGKSPQIIDSVGRIDKYGFMPTGNLSIRNGYGYASWRIKVIGYSNYVFVRIQLTKEGQGEWIVKGFSVDEK